MSDKGVFCHVNEMMFGKVSGSPKDGGWLPRKLIMSAKLKLSVLLLTSWEGRGELEVEWITNGQ